MKSFEELLLKSKTHYLWMRDIESNLPDSQSAKYGLVHRALEKQTLIRLTKGIYLIGQPYKQRAPDLFEVSCLMYPFSYVSMQSSLSYWNWIPERAYTTTSVTTNRSHTIENALGKFTYFKTPKINFFYGVNHMDSSSETSYLLARPWKAFADLIDWSAKAYKNLEDVEEDLRIEKESMLEHGLQDLRFLSENYSKGRVRVVLKNLLKELVQCL
ncbi:MAG: hypothetical protein HYW48_08315 [Deltaproteobacteria bacterium]|nr:hypothetical protein [Deltaproteobacteria bacterium]